MARAAKVEKVESYKYHVNFWFGVHHVLTQPFKTSAAAQNAVKRARKLFVACSGSDSVWRSVPEDAKNPFDTRFFGGRVVLRAELIGGRKNTRVLKTTSLDTHLRYAFDTAARAFEAICDEAVKDGVGWKPEPESVASRHIRIVREMWGRKGIPESDEEIAEFNVHRVLRALHHARGLVEGMTTQYHSLMSALPFPKTPRGDTPRAEKARANCYNKHLLDVLCYLESLGWATHPDGDLKRWAITPDGADTYKRTCANASVLFEGAVT